MRKLVGIMAVVLLAACATEEADNVSAEGPKKSTTTTEEREETTTTAAPTTTLPPVPVEVGRWANSADTDTENVTVEDTWELHWNVQGGAGMSVAWYVPGEEFSADSISLDPGQGSSVIRRGGTFYFEFSTFGASFEVWVVDVPN